jgi:hypothetical protein
MFVPGLNVATTMKEFNVRPFPLWVKRLRGG